MELSSTECSNDAKITQSFPHLAQLRRIKTQVKRTEKESWIEERRMVFLHVSSRTTNIDEALRADR